MGVLNNPPSCILNLKWTQQKMQVWLLKHCVCGKQHPLGPFPPGSKELGWKQLFGSRLENKDTNEHCHFEENRNVVDVSAKSPLRMRRTSTQCR